METKRFFSFLTIITLASACVNNEDQSQVSNQDISGQSLIIETPVTFQDQSAICDEAAIGKIRHDKMLFVIDDIPTEQSQLSMCLKSSGISGNDFSWSIRVSFVASNSYVGIDLLANYVGFVLIKDNLGNVLEAVAIEVTESVDRFPSVTCRSLNNGFLNTSTNIDRSISGDTLPRSVCDYGQGITEHGSFHVKFIADAPEAEFRSKDSGTSVPILFFKMQDL